MISASLRSTAAARRKYTRMKDGGARDENGRVLKIQAESNRPADSAQSLCEGHAGASLHAAGLRM
jgi:hypothetical protein